MITPSIKVEEQQLTALPIAPVTCSRGRMGMETGRGAGNTVKQKKIDPISLKLEGRCYSI